MSKYRLPKSVAASLAKGAKDTLTLHEVSSLYLKLRKDCTSELGGAEALNWCWRMLRQEKVIKSALVGNAILPEVVDLYFGPSIMLYHFVEDIDKVSSLLVEPAVVVKHAKGGTLVFTQYDGEAVTVQGVPFELAKFSMKDATLLDEGSTKFRSIRKNAEGASCGYSSVKIVEPGEIAGLTLLSSHLLTANSSFQYNAEFVKVDEELGLVLGWAIICKKDGEPYFDTQGDHIPEHGMLEAAVDFMLSDRISKEMHVGDGKGKVVFLWPMTAEVAKAFGIETATTGMMIAVRPEDPEYLEAFKNGELTGFSIGGSRYRDHTEVVTYAD